MSGFEIERKFLVKKAGSPWREQAFSCTDIQQGYFDCNGATVRVRIRGDKAYLTIKGPSFDGGMSRYEFEKEITGHEALALLQLCKGGCIKKTRYLVKSNTHTWEIDEFHGINEGLVLAEVELSNAEQEFDAPPFIDKEVTGDRHFYNSHILHDPYPNWKDKYEL